MTRKLIFGGFVFVGIIALVIFVTTCVAIVPAGNLASIYTLRDGVSEKVLKGGWHVITPVEHITLYKVSQEQMVCTNDPEVKDKNGGGFDITCKDGKMNIGFTMVYSFDPSAISQIATQFRAEDGEDIIRTRVLPNIPAWIGEISTRWTVTDAYQGNREQLNMDIKEHIAKKLASFHINVDQAMISSAVLDPNIEAAMTARAQINQEMEAAKQQQEKVKIEAENRIIEATGKANAAIEEARGVAETNRLLEQSLTPLIIQKMQMENQKLYYEKWNGELPKIQGVTNGIMDMRGAIQ